MLQDQQTPHLRIAHLIVITTFVAAMTAWWQWCSDAGSVDPVGPSRLFVVYGVCWAVVQGALLAAFVFLVAKFRRTECFITAPGHWVLFLFSLPIPLFMLVYTAQVYPRTSAVYLDDYPKWPLLVVFEYPDLIYCFTYVVLTVAWLLVAVRWEPRFTRAWNIACLLLMCVCASSAWLHLTMLINADGSIALGRSLRGLAFVAMVAAAWRDRRSQIQYDWLHWYAMSVSFMAFVINPIIQYFAYRAFYASQ